MWQLGRSHVTATGATLTIPAGSAYSGKFDYRAYSRLAIGLPATVDGEVLGIQASGDGLSWAVPEKWGTGTEASAGQFVVVEPNANGQSISPIPYFRLRTFNYVQPDPYQSPTEEDAIQSADRVFQVFAMT